MGKNSILMFAFLMVFALCSQAASGQITITIPKIPRIKKVTTPQPQINTQVTSPAETSGSQPNNGQPAVNQPAVQNKDKYANNGAVNFDIQEIQKWQKMVDEYDPATKIYLVPASNDNFLLYAVSPAAREKWMKKIGVLDIRQTPNNRLDAALDALNASALKKLPSYKPKPALFKFRDTAAEKLLMNYFKNPASVKVYQIGVDSAGWQIQKDGYGLPSYRYKDANVYLRDTSDDQPFCHVYSVRVKQDYAGGGTYGTEVYRSSATEELVGCPANAK